jgi:transposase-like protein
LSVKELLPDIPVFKFRYESTNCPICAKKLKVYSTERFRQGVTLHLGKFIARHTILYCDCGYKPTIFRSKELKRLLPKHANYGYDIIEYIGKAIFQRFRTELEVVEELALINIHISSSEVGYLAKKFIVHLSVLHKNSGDKIKECMQTKGGYILHIDGTCEGGSPHLISALDEISKFVLANIKIPTENADDIAGLLLKKVKKRFGKPVAVVSDLGKAMLGAISTVFPGILVFVCHFHFLRDIGKDLLAKPYEQIRNSLKKYGISKKLRYRLQYYLKFIDNLEISFDKIMQYEKLPEDSDKSKLSTICYTFIQWALDGKMQGNGYGFPFDKPHFHFYERLCVMFGTLKKMENEMSVKSDRNSKTIRYLINDLQPLIEDIKVKEAATDFLQKNEVFEKLRSAMRIAGTDSKEGLNDEGENEDIKTIEQKTVNFRNWLVNDKIYKDAKAYHKMIEQIDKYRDKLFADPIIMKTPNGKISVQPQRTNNILEQFFRDFKRSHRRTSGNKSIAKKLQTMFADTTLVKNLDNPEYMNIILSGKTSLAECFAKTEHDIIQKEFKRASQPENKIPAKIRNFIKKEDVPKLFLNLRLN